MLEVLCVCVQVQDFTVLSTLAVPIMPTLDRVTSLHQLKTARTTESPGSQTLVSHAGQT